MLPRSWKKSINNGIVIPVKMRRCNDCKGEILCDDCNNQVNQNKNFEANLNLMKSDIPNEFGHMLPYHKYQVKLKKATEFLDNFFEKDF